jgi:hypothetical protein
MIISHKHKFIFIKTKKTAGTTLEILLSTICGKNDIITPISKEDEQLRKKLGGLPPQNYYMPFSSYKKLDWYRFLTKREKKKFYNHITAEEIKSNINQKVWQDYFKFCFERNPWDKTISLFYYKQGYKKYKNIYDYIYAGELGTIKGFDSYTINRIVAVDKIYKMENMEEALKDISTRLKLNNELKPPEFKAKGSSRKDKRSYKEILNQKEKKLIDIMFAREVKLLNYKF